jgi:N-acyl-D-aspartate/D-glutamate deacylase
MEFDLLVRGGTVVDGSGRPSYQADVAVKGDRIVEVGTVKGSATQTIDASGRIVTPGFFDPHTHLDAQLGWDPTASSVCWHGVTSIVLGNCAVTFAPCRPDDHATLAEMMESVEQIPAATIMAGLPWDWESYGDYLGSLGRMPRGVNVGGMVGHAALRYYAMGPDCLAPDRHPDDAELEVMRQQVDEAISAGALGISTSRTLTHKVTDGRPIPGTFAEAAEVFALGEPLTRAGRGLLEIGPGLGEYDEAGDRRHVRAEVAWYGEFSRRTGRPVTFSLFFHEGAPDVIPVTLEEVDRQVAAGAVLRPQVAPRRIGVLRGLTYGSPWTGPTWDSLKPLDLPTRVARLRDPAVHRALVGEAGPTGEGRIPSDKLFLLGIDRADYRYGPDHSLAALAAAAGETPVETYLRMSRDSDGRAMFAYTSLNHSFDALETMIGHPTTVIGLGDSGAHVSSICDSSTTTFLLADWVRDRGLLTLEEGVRRLTSDPAQLFGQSDRGLVAEGAYADLNVIDLEQLDLAVPEYVHDFPGGAGRFIQRSHGYDATVVNGQIFMQDGKHTGATAGQMLLGSAS